MGPARIYPCRKMHRSRAPSIAPGTFFVAQPWADCITNMPGFNLRQAQGLLAQAKLSKRDGESEAQCFSRVYQADIDFRKRWANLTEMQQLLALTKTVN